MLVRECRQNAVKWSRVVSCNAQERFRFLDSRHRHVLFMSFHPRPNMCSILFWCLAESQKTQHQKRQKDGFDIHDAYYEANATPQRLLTLTPGKSGNRKLENPFVRLAR